MNEKVKVIKVELKQEYGEEKYSYQIAKNIIKEEKLVQFKPHLN